MNLENDSDLAGHSSTSWHPWMIIAVTVGLWSMGLGGNFVWIDRVEILEAGYRVTNWDDFAQIWSTSLDSYLERQTGDFQSRGGYLRPVYALGISLDWLLWENLAWPYKLHNIFWHSIVAVSLYFLGLRIFGQLENAASLSLISSLLFSMHPFGVHSVTWISGRKDTMCAAFAIMALILFCRVMESREKPLPSRKPHLKGITMLLACMSLFLAILCKELAVVTPLFATLLLWYRWPGSNTGRKPACWLLLLFWTGVIAMFAYRQFAIGGIGLNASHPIDRIDAILGNSFRLIAAYIGRTVFPVYPTIVDRWSLSSGFGPSEIFSGLLVGGVLIVAVVGSMIRQPLGLALGWFFVWLIPAMGLVPLNHMYAERYLYPASWGLVLGFVIVVDAIWPKFSKIDARYLVFTLVGLLLGMQTIRAIPKWKNEQTLFGDAIAQNENYVEGLMYFAQKAMDGQEYQRAIEFLNRAEESLLDKNYKSYASRQVLYTNKGIAQHKAGDFQAAESSFQQVLRLRPNNSLSHYHLARNYFSMRHLKQSEQHYLAALEITPSDVMIRSDLGKLYLSTERYQECIATIEPVLEIDAEHLLSRINLGAAYLISEQFRKAKDMFRFIADKRPRDVENLAKLAWSEFELGDNRAGRLTLARATELDPDNSVVQFVNQRYRPKK